jgi:hypothetical protein
MGGAGGVPFQSEAQRRYLWANDPKVAQKWADKYGTPKNLPMHKRKKARRKVR